MALRGEGGHTASCPTVCNHGGPGTGAATDRCQQVVQEWALVLLSVHSQHFTCPGPVATGVIAPELVCTVVVASLHCCN